MSVACQSQCFGGSHSEQAGQRASVVPWRKLNVSAVACACFANTTHRDIKEDMSSKMSVGRVAISLSQITLRSNWV